MRRSHSQSFRGRKEVSVANPNGVQPISYAGTQVNLYGPGSQQSHPYQNQPPLPPQHGNNPYNSYAYPPMGYTPANGVQLGLVTEHMLRKLDESRLMTMTEIMRRAYNVPNQGFSQPYVQEPMTPRQAVDWPPRARDVSPGNGDWKGQIEHIFAHLMDIAGEDRSFRRNIGEPLFGEITSADLDEGNDFYRLTLTFSRPTERKFRSITSSSPKKIASPTVKRRVAPVLRAEERPKPVKPSSPSGRFGSTRAKAEKERDEASQYEKENIKQEGTLKPYRNFSAEADAELLRKAMKGLGTDEDAIISVFGNRSNKQRQDVIKQYKTMFGKDLVKDLKSELSGDLWKTIKALCLTPAEYDATELRNAIKGLGTDDSTVIEIICTRTNKSINVIKDTYKRLFNKSLEEDIRDDTSGHYQRLLVALLQGNRDDETNVIDRTLAKKEAKAIQEAGAQKWGTDESRFNAILVQRSKSQLRATFDEYKKMTGKSIEDVIKTEMSGDLASGMLTIVRCIQNKAFYFARQLYKAMKGLGTDDECLIRVVVSRCEVDMVQIKEEFRKEYKQGLGQFIAEDTSGDYCKILLSLIGESSAARAGGSSNRRTNNDSD